MRLFIVAVSFLGAVGILDGVQPSVQFTCWALGVITIAAKVIAIPWVLKRTLPGDLYERREINQALNIPSSLLLALLLAIAAEFLVSPMGRAITADPVIQVNLPIGLAGVLTRGLFVLLAAKPCRSWWEYSPWRMAPFLRASPSPRTCR